MVRAWSRFGLHSWGSTQVDLDHGKSSGKSANPFLLLCMGDYIYTKIPERCLTMGWLAAWLAGCLPVPACACLCPCLCLALPASACLCLLLPASACLCLLLLGTAGLPVFLLLACCPSWAAGLLVVCCCYCCCYPQMASGFRILLCVHIENTILTIIIDICVMPRVPEPEKRYGTP